MQTEKHLEQYAELSQKLYENIEERNEILARINFITKAMEGNPDSQRAEFNEVLTTAVEGTPVQVEEVVEEKINPLHLYRPDTLRYRIVEAVKEYYDAGLEEECGKCTKFDAQGVIDMNMHSYEHYALSSFDTVLSQLCTRGILLREGRGAYATFRFAPKYS